MQTTNAPNRVANARKKSLNVSSFMWQKTTFRLKKFIFFKKNEIYSLNLIAPASLGFFKKNKRCEIFFEKKSRAL